MSKLLYNNSITNNNGNNMILPTVYTYIYIYILLQLSVIIHKYIMGIQPTQYGDVMIYNPTPGSVLKQPQDIVVDVM